MVDDPHFGYIFAAFLVAGLVVLGVSLSIWLDYRRVMRELISLEQAGTRRRSNGDRG
ncbi:MAG: heme exporter protein CcmD [Alphaproteobacteria bacterium]|jgi:heme exporter protein CcmD|nr:heme exporter protein CcmD [Alphaproteobacteria bacterium]